MEVVTARPAGALPRRSPRGEVHMTDDEAVRRCQEGDREAFRHLVEAYKSPMYGTALLMTGNPALAEEHVQDALLNAWRGIRRFQRGRPVKPWLMRILVNAVVSQQRRRSFTTVSLDESLPVGAPGDDTETVENRQVLREALSQLSPEHREVVVLRYFADLSVAEVARSTGVREGTVKSRLHRALRQMRELLEQSGVMEVAGNDA
ncbi:MAG: RNA polymerase sigma factor [Chloroflexi bacterium]|nr:RNA polymerase sigma factor [Chloroflexota bacterium]MYD65624.1 RNA polymerase sigma factor [Chloroflexota bacterium]